MPQAFLVEITAHPVGIHLAHVGDLGPEEGLAVVLGRIPRAGGAAGFTLEGDVLVGIHHVERAPVIDAHAHETVVDNLRLAFPGLFRSDEDHAVGALRSVDGRRGGILQNVDRLDVARVDRGERLVVGNTVEHDQRVVARVGRTRAADADRTSVDADAGHTDQAGGQVVCRNAGDLFGRYRSHRSGDVLTLHGRIARHHDIFQTDHVLAQRHVDSCARPDLFLLRHHSEEAEFQFVVASDPFDAVGARGVGRYAERTAHDGHGRSGNRIALAVADRSADGAFPCGGGNFGLDRFRSGCRRSGQQRDRQQKDRALSEDSARSVPTGPCVILVQILHNKFI